MTDLLLKELKNVLYVLLHGACFAGLYDVLLNIRHFIKHNTVAVSVEDILFWFMVSIKTLMLMIKINDGQTRSYLIAGMIIGAALYEVSLHLLLKKICKVVTIKIKKRGGIIAERRKEI